jgi:hypothetical protein
MSFLKKLFGSKQWDGEAMAQSPRLEDSAQIALLAYFAQEQAPHGEREQHLWERVLPRTYDQQLDFLQKQGWLEKVGNGYRITDIAQPFIVHYHTRLQREKDEAMRLVRKAVEDQDTSEALAIRRRYEAAQPLGSAQWTGPEPQLSHSALTRRILFLDHWLIEGLSAKTAQWLKRYAAEQQLWGTTWRLDRSSIPEDIGAELATADLDSVEAAYWRAYGLALYVENQETWQRCKGGDHVRRIQIGGPDDEYTCAHCRQFRGEQYLVARVPELPHRACTSVRGCRCEYVPVLES